MLQWFGDQCFYNGVNWNRFLPFVFWKLVGYVISHLCQLGFGNLLVNAELKSIFYPSWIVHNYLILFLSFQYPKIDVCLHFHWYLKYFRPMLRKACGRRWRRTWHHQLQGWRVTGSSYNQRFYQRSAKNQMSALLEVWRWYYIQVLKSNLINVWVFLRAIAPKVPGPCVEKFIWFTWFTDYLFFWFHRYILAEKHDDWTTEA